MRYALLGITLILLGLVALFLARPLYAPRSSVLAAEKKVLESSLAGSWYPAEKAALSTAIQGYLDAVPDSDLKGVQALILPHAGYRYSAQCAAYGLRTLDPKKIDRVFILGPSHRTQMENVASIPEVSHYATPLGEVELDSRLIKKLKESPYFRSLNYAHQDEHSVQIQIPLLQHCLDDFLLVPILVGTVDEKSARAMAAVLSSVLDEKSLVIASSDFTHYGPNYDFTPFTEKIPEGIARMDKGALAFIQEKNMVGFLDYCKQSGATICGRSPIAVLLALLPAASRPQLLHYTTSGALSQDYSNSVSYCAIAFSGSWEKAVAPAQSATTGDGFMELSDSDKTALLALARNTMRYALEERKMPEAATLGLDPSPALQQVCGAFVTLKKSGQLRGCIGDIFPSRPLYKAVMGNAIHAAFRDRRFTPVALEEIPDLQIEISVLTPPEAIPSYEGIEVGRHGVLLSKGKHRAVFLPQVAPEQGWDRATMLNHLSTKAGLSENAWQSGATFEVFEAIIFHEDDQ